MTLTQTRKCTEKDINIFVAMVIFLKLGLLLYAIWLYNFEFFLALGRRPTSFRNNPFHYLVGLFSHIDWAKSMPFASIDPTHPRTNLWKSGENCWDGVWLKNSVFLTDFQQEARLRINQTPVGNWWRWKPETNRNVVFLKEKYTLFDKVEVYKIMRNTVPTYFFYLVFVDLIHTRQGRIKWRNCRLST